MNSFQKIYSARHHMFKLESCWRCTNSSLIAEISLAFLFHFYGPICFSRNEFLGIFGKGSFIKRSIKEVRREGGEVVM